MQIIAWDGGRHENKAKSGDFPALRFPSRVGEAVDMNIGEKLNYLVGYGGEEYFVGEAAEESFCRREMATASKIHDEAKLMCLASCGLLAREETIHLVTGLPYSQHKDTVKASMSTLLKGTHNVAINGKKKTFTIVDVGIVPEGVGSYYVLKKAEPSLPKRMVRILMVGSRTITGITIDHGKYLNRQSFTLDYGCMEADNAQGNVDKQFARKIAADASKRWLDYKRDTDVVILTGGGLLRMPELRDHFTVTMIPKNPVTADVEGMEMMGQEKWPAK